MFDENKFEKNFASKPLVSVIIPTFNSMTGTKNVDKTLKSIMNQTYQNIEVLVIDNFSIDTTYNVCKSYPIRFFRLGGNRSKARNYGISRMRGDYALFSDSDHILTPKVVEDCVNQALHSNADCIIVPVKFVSGGKARIDCSQMRALESKLELGARTFILFYSKDLIRNIRFPESVELGEDMIFSSRALDNKPIISRVKSIIYHIEDESVKNLVFRSWDYGKRFRLTISEIGLRNSTRLISDLSALNIRKLVKGSKIISNDSNGLMTILCFSFYILIKHLSFGISYCLSLLEKYVAR